MKKVKRIISIVLAIVMLNAVPMAANAQEDLRAKDVSIYPTLRLSGGWHPIDYPDGTPAFQPGAGGEVLSSVLDGAMDALKRLDFDRVVDLLVQAFRDWFGPIRMGENGESVTPNLTSEVDNLTAKNLHLAYEFEFSFDWRLDPVKNAEKLEAYLELLEETRPGVEKYNFYAQSGGGPVMLAYLQFHGFNRVASVVFDITMHNGTTMWGELAKRKLVIDTQAVGKLQAASLSMEGFALPPLQPLLRILYESGLLEIIERVLKLASYRIIDRVYDEILIPLIFTMPGIWNYVPQKDYDAAKKALFNGDPKYAGLVAKLDYYRRNVLDNADRIILDAAAQVKVAVRAGYGMPMPPLGKGSGAQSDGMVDTAYASIGATCAPLGRPFLPWYKQKKDAGHNHISPDRMIDASTCLLPDQTWFALDKPHISEHQYSGWYGWFKRTANPTVFSSGEYPQFVRMVGPSIDWVADYEPLVVEPEPAWLAVLKAAGLWILNAWRWLLRLPLAWA